jgi:hypothetical protein
MRTSPASEPSQKDNPFTEVLNEVHPLVLGSGRRLFRDGSPFAALRLVDAVTTAAGVVIASYQPANRGR